MTHNPEPASIEGATCALFRDAPSWQGRRTVAIGRFSCASAAAGTALLDGVAARLRNDGVEALIGPMDGDTWHSYRLVEESDGAPPFLMEPRSGPHDLAAFLGAGFAPVSRYVSTRVPVETAIGPGAPWQPEGLAIRPWDGANAEDLIARLFALSSAQFAANAFFKPIAREAFLDLYRPVMAAIDPRLVLFAVDAAGDIAGFLFGLPDHLEGPRPATAILKTYASRIKGAGRALADHFHRSLPALGYTTVIHALMHIGNASLDRSSLHGAEVFRRYALMGRRLT